jgi:AcrR family transcriptional regulator
MPPATTHPTSEALVAAGIDVAEELGLSRMTIDAVVERAGVAKGTFYVHFRDRAAYLLALHRRFHDELRIGIAAAIDGLPPGASRLRLGAEAYLDGCLAARGVKALLLEARSERAIREEVRRSDARFSADAEGCFEALGYGDASASARLFVAMTAEAALAELESGKRRDDVRRALWRLVRLNEEEEV